MKIETLWKTIIKLFGIWFLIGGLSTILEFSQTFFYATKASIEAITHTILWLIGIIIIYSIVVRLFLFKTDWIIEKLKLSQNYTEEKIDISIKNSTVITISIIIIGGITLVDSIPRLLSETYEFLQQKMSMRDYPKFSWLILQLLKAFIGYLMITKSKIITKYIEKESGLS
jgi:hypothetical protein